MSGAGRDARPRILEWREHRKGDKLGAVSVAFASGLVLHEVTIHRSGQSCWAAPPARPKLKDGSNELWIGRDDRPVWEPIVSFVDVDIRRRWSDQVIAALRMDRPEVLADLHEEDQQP